MNFKRALSLLTAVSLLCIGLCGCADSVSSEDETISIASTESEDVESDSTSMISRTEDSLQIFLELLGTESEDGQISVTDEFLDNQSNVYIMGKTGTVMHGFGEDSETCISIMEWTDNDSATAEDFSEFVALLNDYFGETGQVKSYDNYSDETYVWRDYDHTSYVLCWYADDTIQMNWHYDESVKKSDEETDNETEVNFTNAYGTPTTKCAHAGCNNYIASSGDTNCCTTHSNRCLECGKYIDEDASYCVSCIEKAAKGAISEKHTCEECGKEASYTITGITGQTEYYCYTHYKEMQKMYDNLFGDD